MGGLLRYTNAIVGMGLVGIGIAMIASPELVVPEMYGKKKNGQRVKGEPSTGWVAIGCFEFFMGVVLCMSFYWGKNVRFGLGAMYLCLMCALMYDLSQNATKSGLAPFGLQPRDLARHDPQRPGFVVALRDGRRQVRAQIEQVILDGG